MEKFNAILINSQNTDVYYNLSAERLLLKGRLNCPILYVWQSENAVVIGSNQNPYTECNLSAMQNDNVQLSRRITGGGAVYHDNGNINFSFISPKSLYSESANFEIVIGALKSLGINATVTGRNDILVGESKISGNAFYRGKEFCLHHGTLLVSSDLNKLSLYLNPPKEKLEKRGVKSVKSRVKNLSEIAPQISTKVLITALYRAFCEKYTIVKQANIEEIICIEEHNGEITKISSKDYLFAKWEEKPYYYTQAFEWGIISFSAKLNNCEIVEQLSIQTDCMYPQIKQRLEDAFLGKKLNDVSKISNPIFEEDKIFNDAVSVIKENI